MGINENAEKASENCEGIETISRITNNSTHAKVIMHMIREK